MNGHDFFTRQLSGYAFFLTACDDPAPVAKTDAPAATVLEGKTMGTFWRVSVMNLDKTRTDELRGKNPCTAGRRRSAAVDL